MSSGDDDLNKSFYVKNDTNRDDPNSNSMPSNLDGLVIKLFT